MLNVQQIPTDKFTIPELTKKITSLPVPLGTQYEMNKYSDKLFLPQISKKQSSMAMWNEHDTKKVTTEESK